MNHAIDERRTGPSTVAVLLGGFLLAAFVILATPGCGGGPALSSENRELIVSLATAVSTREPKWLDENLAVLDKHRAEGRCTDLEYQALKGIIDKAKAGEWDAAQEEAYALRDAQEPTAEERRNLNERKVSHVPRKLDAKGKPKKS